MNDTTVTTTGNLTADPVLQYTPQGVAWMRFTVASTPRVFDKGRGEYRDGDTLFLICNAWRDMAEHIAESLSKGTRVIVTGRLTQSSWETDNGEKRTGYVVQVEDIGPSLRFAAATVRKTPRP
jgi:single-strand DNA-binding protein